MISVRAATTTVQPGSSINTLGSHHWKQILHIHTRWAGTYQYRGQSYNFRLKLRSNDVEGLIVGNVTAAKAKFNVKGRSI